MVGDAVLQGGGHLGVGDHGYPFDEGQVGGGNQRSLLIERGCPEFCVNRYSEIRAITALPCLGYPRVVIFLQ